MNYQELYSLIFIDSFVANIVFCFANEIAVETVKVFNNYNVILIIILASSASILAYYIDYLFGRVVFQIVKPFQKEDGKVATEQFRKLSDNNYFKILLMISALTIYGKFQKFSITNALRVSSSKKLVALREK